MAETRGYTLTRVEVKRRLIELADPEEEFEVIFSGKASKKVDGLYKPDTREIVLHTKNFGSDDELMYTAIHELAHHIHFTGSPLPISSKAHTQEFWSLFHGLLIRAERAGLYHSPFETIDAFRALTKRIRNEFLSVNGELMKDLGSLLLEAQALCETHRASFQDYLERVLRLPRTSARTIIRSHQYDLDPEVGFENMRTLTRISEREPRDRAQASLLEGQTLEMVKADYLSPRKSPSPLEALAAEKRRIERTIQSLQRRLAELEARMQRFEDGPKEGRQEPP